MQKSYVLTESELANFADDSVRSEIRARVAASAEADETVQIQSENGDVYDVVSGSTPQDDFGVVLSDDEIREKRHAEALREAEIEHIEKEVKPLVMQRLRVLARHEIREEIREKENEILSLRAQLAKAQKGEPAANPDNERPES